MAGKSSVFGTKRHKPPLWLIPVSASSPVSSQDPGRGFPPPKQDPLASFDFNEDFTEADLEEIDMIASQALAQGPNEPVPRSTVSSEARGKPPMNASATLGSARNDQLAGKEVKDHFGFEVLQEQQEELKLKLKAMQEEILLKNGEIKILRESLTHSNSRIEEQRRAHLLYEKETTRYLSDKEKEFSRKLLSLQTELHFKDAEMNELKLTVQAKEHVKKAAVQAPSLVRKSPIRDIKKEACSAKPEKIIFPTKESFSRSLSLKRPHPAAQPCVPAPRSKDRKVAPTDQSLHANDNKAPVRGSGFVKQELKQKSFTHSWLQRQTSRGSILINALLKQPLAPGSTLGLSHLLGSNSETSPGAILQLHLLGRFRSVLSSQVLPYCLCATTPLSAVHWLVQLLALLVDHEDVALQLCSLSETCPLLLLYLYVASRPDKSATETLWLHLEQEVVQFLAKLCVLDVGSPAVLVGSRCQCKHEVIKTLVVMLHRQWLTVRRAIGKLCKRRQRTVQCLRDMLLLLYTLSQRDKHFHEHCLEVLHQYDQVLLGIRTLFRSLPDLTGCEEMALEELCPVEPDMEDVVNQEMDCS
ncbi:ATR-interacting protein isoform X3 [Tachyglossus aculeatus]|uniref:ATR-interacting protein isoform X3 n=1 Tax=Tachyglossus aculeatus TaxID=9261 RepID=UPI0018F6CF2F|nr:ATR-interacting protein isoform X3 [Tachyglossus aculeatus]